MIEVLREGEATTDGRFILHGAIDLPEDSVPLFDFDKDGQSDKYTSVGILFNFQRGADYRIYCESSVDDDRLITVTVAIDKRETVGGEEVGISSGRILGGVLGGDLTYPWD